MALNPGSRLGRYVVVRQLGAGAMGEVYLAEDPHIERRVAIKTVRLDLQEQVSDATRDQLRMRFAREAKAAGRLVHPHVVTLFDAADVDGLFYLAFEYVDGADLSQRVRRGPSLTVRDIVRLGRQAAAALEAAHRVGIIHRDIKPSNLLLTNDGVLKIADFGIATLIGADSHLTQTGSLIGTPQYLSPEQVKSETPLDGRSDLFSIGVVLYELLAGKRPFEGGSMAALLYAIVTNEPVPLSALRPDLPPRLSAAVMRLLAKEREARFESAAALGMELEEIDRELHEDDGTSAIVAPDQAPTVVVRAPLPTRLATTKQEALPETMQQAPTPPATLLESRDQPRVRRRGLVIASVAATALIAASLAISRLTDETIDAVSTKPATTAPAPTTTGTAAPLPVEPTTPATTLSEPVADEEVQIVGGAITVEVSPSEAAGVAVVKIDGLVRGLAQGSMMTLRPGRHAIAVSAEGYATTETVVEAREDVEGVRVVPVTLVREES